MTKIVVYHTEYGCDTGCCGHVVQMGEHSQFEFCHPYGDDAKEFAQRLVVENFGADHVKDLDWDSCIISED